MLKKMLKKEEHLLEAGRSQKTIDFVKRCKVGSENLVWFVTRIDKDKFDIEDEDAQNKIKKILKLFKRNKESRNMNNINDAYALADSYFEDEDDIKSRILHKFKDKHYIINLSPKELSCEGTDMHNCVDGYVGNISNKKTAILALRDSKDKTIVHIEVKKTGSLGQHYEKANYTVKSKNWKYISEFFKIHEDKNITKKLKEKGFEGRFRVGKDYNGIPVVEYFMPTVKQTNILNDNDDIVSIRRIKDFISPNKKVKFTRSESYNKEEIKDKLKEYSKFVQDSVEEMCNNLEESSDNYYILNDDITKKIYGEILSESVKMKTLIESGDERPMAFEYNGEEGIGMMVDEARIEDDRPVVVENDRPMVVGGNVHFEIEEIDGEDEAFLGDEPNREYYEPRGETTRGETMLEDNTEEEMEVRPMEMEAMPMEMEDTLAPEPEQPGIRLGAVFEIARDMAILNEREVPGREMVEEELGFEIENEYVELAQNDAIRDVERVND